MNLPKDYATFKTALTDRSPIKEWPIPLKAMWYDANKNWEGAHNLVQDLDTSMGSWIHAYLHRKEGDDFNASYWYGKANKPFPVDTLEREHEILVLAILDDAVMD